MEERQGQFFLLKRSQRRGNADRATLPGLEDVGRDADIRPVEQLEEAVDDIDFFRRALDVEKKLPTEWENLVRPQAVNPAAQPLQLLGQPLHLRPVRRSLVAHDDRNERIARAGPKRGKRLVEIFHHGGTVTQYRRVVRFAAVELVQESGQADATGN